MGSRTSGEGPGGGGVRQRPGRGQALRSIADLYCSGNGSARFNRDGVVASSAEDKGGDVGRLRVARV
jgi:hypothetical protein